MLRLAAIIRVGLGVLLLGAAALKLTGIGVSAMPRAGWFAQPWVQLAAAEWEIILGFWLLSGAYPVGSWFAALGTFLTFAIVSASLGISGVSSCGCLGAIQASPWWAFGVDGVAIILLCVSRPTWQPITARTLRHPAGYGLKWFSGVAVLLVGLSLAASAVYGTPDAALARLRGETLLTESHLDLGAGKAGTTLKATATIRNVSNRPVRLVGGTSDCSCTVLSDLPVTIEPGESASVGIQLNVSPTELGRLTHKVFLRTDDPARPVLQFAIGYRIE